MTTPTEKRVRLWLEEQQHELSVARAGSDSFELALELEGAKQSRSLRLLRGAPAPVVLVDGRVLQLALFEQAGEQRVGLASSVLRVRSGHGHATLARRSAPADAGLVVAPMPGRVVAIRAALGDAVEKGALVLVIEAMKMQNELFSASTGRVQEVLVQVGDTVERGAALVRIG